MSDGIIVRGLTKTYRKGRVKALVGVDAEFPRGRAHGLIGPNGSGKTTLMGCVLGLLHRDGGTITIDGATPEDQAFRAGVGYVPERLRFDMWMRGWAFMEYHDRLSLQAKEGRNDRIKNCLERVGLAESAWIQPLKTYSRGMLQRIGLAQAILHKPKTLFLDEPTSGMDPGGVALFRSVVQAEIARGCLVLLSSHQLAHVEQLCDSIHFIERGSVTTGDTMAPDSARRVIRVRWADPPRAARPIARVLDLPKVRLVETKERGAVIEVEGDEGAAEVLAALIGAGYPVAEATPAASRLERYFTAEAAETHD